ncbi:MAG: Na+/H+ antiporter [Chitinophagaceae bacterium]
MQNYSIVIMIMAIMLLLSALADKIRIPSPILLITAGIGIGFIPQLPHIELDPEVIFLIFLPPLLHDAAFNISFKDFRTNINTIGTLAISLVFITALSVAVTAHYLIPGMTWPLSFVLGAILSATDAVAAISITKGLGLSHKTVTILEGESLVNDASALVIYRFAVAAVTGSVFIWWKASLQFIILMAGGLLVGVLLERILAFILQRVQRNSTVAISFMLLMPFIAYRLAEELHVSGVIAVVILGLGIARYSRKVFPDSIKMQSKAFWDTIIFLLNGLIFILIGLQFPYVVTTISKNQILTYLGYAFVVTIVVLVVRIFRVFLQRAGLLREYIKGKRRVSKDALLDFNTSLVVSWAGMRGIVSLATAIGLPATLNNGEPFPQRTPIIFISIAVVLFTLIGQGLPLPWLVRTIRKVHPAPVASKEPDDKLAE